MTDAGSQPFVEQPLACYQPPPGGILAGGFPTPVPGCSHQTLAAGLTRMAVQDGWPFGGSLVVFPAADPATPLPLIFVFHGANQTSDGIRAVLDLEPFLQEPAIVVYPDASMSTWIRTTPDNDDVDRLDRLLARLAGSACVDPSRVYATGLSAGAIFSLYLGCNVPSTFRAVAAVAGTDVLFDTRCCTRPSSTLFIHGRDDLIIPFSVQLDTRRRRAAINACSDTAVTLDANCDTAAGCASGRPVSWCAWSGGHAVPSWGPGEVWDFFRTAP